MKLMMLLVPSECLEDVQSVVDQHDIHAYTEFPTVLGSGRSGRKLGTRAFPGASSMLLAVLDTEEIPRLQDAVREYVKRSACSEGIRMFSLPVEAVI
jgi:hypothetical protein